MDVPKAGGFFTHHLLHSRRVPEHQEADEIVMLSHGFFLRRKNSLAGCPRNGHKHVLIASGEAHIVQNGFAR
jgi:hypothetical protein